jgi:hypothetical protein
LAAFFLYSFKLQDRELRLLSIRKPENQTALIKCDTQTFELSHAPRFDALSYVWGDPSVAKEIQFCGKLPNLRRDCEQVAQVTKAWIYYGDEHLRSYLRR